MDRLGTPINRAFIIFMAMSEAKCVGSEEIECWITISHGCTRLGYYSTESPAVKAAETLPQPVNVVHMVQAADTESVLVSREWLEGLPCPQQCDNGEIAIANGGEWSSMRCQFCDERNALLNTKAESKS